MKGIVLSLIALSTASIAHAQTIENDLVGLGMKPEQADYMGSVVPPGYGTSGYTQDLAFGTGGMQPKFPAAVVITPSTTFPTPSASNTLTERHTIVAAGAPTAAYVVLPKATNAVGESYTVYNQGSNPVAIVPQTGSINVAAALTPFSCTTLKECKCTGLTTSNFGCSQQ